MANPMMESLEERRLLAASYPTAFEQYLVELINRGRANPTAEANRYGTVLNEGLAANQISTAAKQPLALNPYLTSSSHNHSQWMIDTDTFSHTGSGGSDPGGRMQGAGYSFTGSWTWGENIAWRSYVAASMPASLVEQLHKDLFVDAGVTGRGHRLNLMKSDFREIGPGVVSGNFKGYNAGMVTEDFARSGSSIYLTGVAYNDIVTKDNFYTPGEGLSGVTITAKRASDNATFSTTSWSSGGYSLALPAGTYTVTATGGGLPSAVGYGSVTIGSENVKRDFTPDTAPPPTPGDTTAPTVVLTRAKIHRVVGARYYYFAVTYTDDKALDTASFDNLDVIVSNAGGSYARAAVFVSTDNAADGTPRLVNYMVKGPGGSWDAADNGVYTMTVQAAQVKDTAGNAVRKTVVGQFSCRIPTTPALAPALAPSASLFSAQWVKDDSLFAA